MAATESNAESNAARDRADADSPDAPTKAKPSYRWHILIVVVGVGIVLGGVVYLQELRYQEIDQLLKDGDARQALSGTVKMLTDRPSDPRALALQARCLVAMEFNPLKAIEIFDQVGASKKEELHAWAKAYMLTNNWSAALSLLTRVRELDAENADVLYETTICHLRMGDRGEALVTAERFAAMKGHEAPGYMFIATIATDDDNYRRAVLAFEKVFEFEPEAAGLQLAPVEIYYAYGRALLAIGEAERARDALLKSLSLTLPAPPPEAYDTYVTLGNAFTQLGDGGKARTAWSSALALNENGQEARQFLANSDLKAGRPGAALAWIAPVEDRPDLSAATAYTIQRVYQALDNAEKANKWRRLVEQLRKRD
ncbi:MAG: hypothetical protein QF805_29400, partial [Pirellulaceae bacterium]|nr:hypothetical protein [Pirellulaceae bacterium]